MESAGIERAVVSQVIEQMKKLSEAIAKKAESPEEKAHKDTTLELPTGLEVTAVTEAVDGDMARKKKTVGWFIVLAAVTILPVVVIFPDIMEVAVMQGIGLEQFTSAILSFSDIKEYVGQIVGTYKTVYKVFGIVSGILITLFNYRQVAVAGAVLSGLGCLITSFLDIENIRTMAFVYGFLPGLGNNFLYTSVVVAVLECFGDKRLLIVSFTFVIEFLIELILAIVLIVDFQSMFQVSWQWTLRIMSGTYLLCFLASCGLIPLNLYMKDNPRQSLRSRITNTENFRVFKSPLLYSLGGVFFFTGLGQDIPTALVWKWYVFSIVILLAAALVAMVTSCCCFTKMSQKTSMVVIAVVGLVMGMTSLTVKGFDAVPYVGIYSAVYGLGYGVIQPVMRNVIPLVMGDKYLGITVGCLTFASGVGSIIAEKSTEAIIKDLGQNDAPFYLAGLALITSSVMAVVVIKLARRATVNESLSQEEGGGEQDRRSQMEIPVGVLGVPLPKV